MSGILHRLRCGSCMIGLRIIEGALFLVLGTTVPVRADEPSSEREARKPDEPRERIVRAAQEFKLFIGPEKLPLEMQKEPAFRWPNPTRETPEGATLVWTLRGRPEAMACVWRNNNGNQSWAIHSLSESPLSAERDGSVIWAPKSAGINLQPLKNAPPPAKTTAATRLTQMRNLARRFRCRLSGKAGEELRLLPQPIYRYAVEDEKLLDGALFAFVQGTDPEVILMIEARGYEAAAKWHYAITRRSHFALEAELDDQPVWSVPVGAGGRNEAWFESQLPASK